MCKKSRSTFFSVYSTQKRPGSLFLFFIPSAIPSVWQKTSSAMEAKILRTFLRKVAMCVRSPHFCSPLLLARGVHFTNDRFSSFAEQTKKHPREMAAGKATN